MAANAELNPSDISRLVDAASEFASYPGMQNDASVREFLDRFPLPLIFSALQSEVDVPGLQSTLVSCLERIFGTEYGASLIPQYMHFVRVGLQSNSQIVRCLACKAVSYLLEKVGQNTGNTVHLVIEYGIYPLLINCLVDGDELGAAASTEAIKNLAKSPQGIDIIFSTNDDEVTLKNVAAHCSSLARIRVLALIAKLFSVSSPVASAIYDANLLSLFEAEVSNSSDMLMTLSALELLYELSESPHGKKFLLRTTLLQLLSSIISNTSLDSILRSRAILISGRLLSADDIFTVADQTCVKVVLSAIDERLELLKDQYADESESGLEALGQIGSSSEGASLLLSSPLPLARHVVEASFDRQGKGKQLAALHALANISGENQSEDTKMLNDGTEECLRRLIYATAANSSKLTPSGLFLSVLQQDAEIRLAAYRVISGLVSRSWCLLEVCSKQDIINIVTNPQIETTKIGMEARYNCCVAISKSLSVSNKLNDPALSGIVAKLQDAVVRGPYLARERTEVQPVVMTDQRF